MGRKKEEEEEGATEIKAATEKETETFFISNGHI